MVKPPQEKQSTRATRKGSSPPAHLNPKVGRSRSYANLNDLNLAQLENLQAKIGDRLAESRNLKKSGRPTNPPDQIERLYQDPKRSFSGDDELKLEIADLESRIDRINRQLHGPNVLQGYLDYARSELSRMRRQITELTVTLYQRAQPSHASVEAMKADLLEQTRRRLLEKQKQVPMINGSSEAIKTASGKRQMTRWLRANETVSQLRDTIDYLEDLKEKDGQTSNKKYTDEKSIQSAETIDQELTVEQQSIKTLRDDFKRYKARQQYMPLDEKLAYKMNQWRGVRAEGLQPSQYIAENFRTEIEQGLRLSDIEFLDPSLHRALYAEARPKQNRPACTVDELLAQHGLAIDKGTQVSPERRAALAQLVDADVDDPDFHSYLAQMPNTHVAKLASSRKSTLVR